MTRSSPLPTAATREFGYANQSGTPGPSACDYLSRDRSYVAEINAAARVAWSNGDVRSLNAGLADARTAGLLPWSDGVAVVVVDWLVPTTDRWGGLTARADRERPRLPFVCARPGFAKNPGCRRGRPRPRATEARDE